MTTIKIDVKSESYPTRYEPGNGSAIPTRNEPEGLILRWYLLGLEVDHRLHGDRHGRFRSAHDGPSARVFTGQRGRSVSARGRR